MFKSSPNPYDEIVAKATDENQTSENWEIIISLCDKVVDEGEGGARNVIAAILKRLAHRTSNVQLYSLALAEALSKNCGIELHRELCSRSFTQGLEKLVTDRNTHDKVRKRALGLIKTWALEFESDPTLGIMYECYENLKSKHYRFDQATEAPPPDDDDIRRREEEELQRVLEMSRTDTGGLGKWVSNWEHNSGASTSGTSSSKAPSVSNVPSAAPGPGASRQASLSQRPSLNYRKTSGPSPTSVYPTGGYVPSARPVVSTVSSVPEASPTQPSPVRQDTAETSPTQPKTQIARPVAVPSLATSTTIKPAELAPAPKATLSSRVRALHTFEPTEPGELGFEKGDVIKVIERLYKEWWKGQLRGQTGIFPVNYVEPIPEPTPEEITREAQQEATIFAQAAEIDQLLDMLRKVDPAKDNLADNEEIQELYRSCMALRPKIVKLIDRYSQKRADLMNMNESFVRAKKIFDDVMEESLAKYNPGASIYDFNRMPDQPGIGRPTSAYGVRPPTAYGWNPAVYSSPPAAAQPLGPGAGYPFGGHDVTAPNYQAQFGAPQSVGSQTSTAHVPQNQPVSGMQNGAYAQIPVQPQPLGAPGGHPLPQQLQTGPATYQQVQPLSSIPQQQPQPSKTPTPQQNLPQHSFQPIRQGGGLSTVEVSGGSQQPIHGQQQQLQQSQQPASAAQSQPAEPTQSPPGNELPPIDGKPPFPFDATRKYADPNVQAWATYYANGGTEPAGRAYFIHSTLPTSVTLMNSPHVATQGQRLVADPQGQPQQQPQQQYQQGPQQDPSSGGPAGPQQRLDSDAQDSIRGLSPVHQRDPVPIITTTLADNYRGGSPAVTSPQRSNSMGFGVGPMSPTHARTGSLPLGGGRGPLPDSAFNQSFRQLSIGGASPGQGPGQPPEAVAQ